MFRYVQHGVHFLKLSFIINSCSLPRGTLSLLEAILSFPCVWFPSHLINETINAKRIIFVTFKLDQTLLALGVSYTLEAFLSLPQDFESITVLNVS
jgi:hypothetical protein